MNDQLNKIDYMSKRKEQTGADRPGDRHKPGRQVRVRATYIAQLELAAATNRTSVSEELHRFLREGLLRDGLWPPKPDESR